MVRAPVPKVDEAKGRDDMARHKLKPGDPNDLHKPTVRKCAHCGADFVGVGRSRFCSDACKQADYRDRVKAKEKASKRRSDVAS